MRILLEQNKILFSMTKEETQKIQDNHHNPIEITKDNSWFYMKIYQKPLWKSGEKKYGRKAKAVRSSA